MPSRLDPIIESDWKERARVAKYRVAAVARNAKMSRQNLRRFFLCHFGMPPKKWLERLMFEDAQVLLRNGDLVKQVHGRLGFTHPNHLARAFRRIFGLRPGECRTLTALGTQRILQKGLSISKKGRNVSIKYAPMFFSLPLWDFT